MKPCYLLNCRCELYSAWWYITPIANNCNVKRPANRSPSRVLSGRHLPANCLFFFPPRDPAVNFPGYTISVPKLPIRTAAKSDSASHEDVHMPSRSITTVYIFLSRVYEEGPPSFPQRIPRSVDMRFHMAYREIDSCTRIYSASFSGH